MTMPTVPCVLQCGGLYDEATDFITPTERWETLKKKALSWSGLDKFGDVHVTVDWNKRPVVSMMHVN